MRMVDEAESVHFGMGTVMMHRAYGSGAANALKAAQEEINRLERLISRFIPDSEISKVNRFAGMECVEVSPETYEVLSEAVRFSEGSQGIFDVTIGPLVHLWDQGKEEGIPPEEGKIRAILPLVNFRDLQFIPGMRRIGLQKKGESIDLGGIGKGFAGDRVLKMFREYGIKSAFTNLGGNVVTLGRKPDGTPWRVGIQHPRKEGLIGLLSVESKAVVTSGDYQRFFLDKNGNLQHHILDPRSGYPSESELASVTIVYDSAVSADALSTICFIVGLARGVEILRECPGTEAILIDKRLQVSITKGLAKSFTAMEGVDVRVL